MSRRDKVIIPTSLALAMAFGILLGRGLKNVEVSKRVEIGKRLIKFFIT